MTMFEYNKRETNLLSFLYREEVVRHLLDLIKEKTFFIKNININITLNFNLQLWTSFKKPVSQPWCLVWSKP